MRMFTRSIYSGVAAFLILASGFAGTAMAQQRVVTRKAKAKTSTAKEKAKPAPDANVSLADPKKMTVEEVTEMAKKSLVVISHYGRDGKVDGVGSGFVIGKDGLIATSFHVIGEARPIKVSFPDGKTRDVKEVYAWDRKLDLAVLQVDADDLVPLPLGDSDTLKQGSQVVALGNPQGLEYSVVEGVVSARREFEYSEMIQLAIPLEPGNSGGPLLDMFGRVHGILTLKSAVTRNLGFAMPINKLKPMLAKPNPVPMERWLTIGTVNSEEWEPYFGARWVQHGGQISVDGSGQGFGGRSLCLSTKIVPEGEYEVAVRVKMDDETGAAGLIFGAAGENENFGFYPSNGHMRLTHFAGPSVYSWQVLKDEASPYYQAGDWNELRVKVEGKIIKCYVNGQFIYGVSWEEAVNGKVGLAKFRQTEAEYKNFRVGKNLPDNRPAEATVAKILDELKAMKPSLTPDRRLVATLHEHGDEARQVLAERAKSLEKEAEQLRQLSEAVHHKNVQAELARLFTNGNDNPDLFEAAMLVAKLDNEDLEIEPYRRQVERMAKEIITRFPEDAKSMDRIKALNDYLFAENGFRGSRGDYYNKVNSYLNNVIDDREGIPITLSVLYLELAKRIGVEDLVGVGLPGHFVVEYRPKKGDPQFIDVYEGGKPMSRLEAELIARFNDRKSTLEDTFQPYSHKEIILRMLRNLMDSAMQNDSLSNVLNYLDTYLAISPDSATERWSRALIRLRSGDTQGGKSDLRWLLDHDAKGVDLDKAAELYRSL